MEKLKRIRTPLRSSFTKTANNLEVVVRSESPEPDEIAGLISQMKEKYDRLKTVDNEILELLQNDITCDEDTLNSEFESIESYEDKYIILNTKSERLLHRLDSLNETSLIVGDKTVPYRKFKLPNIELKKFKGEIKDWIPFWGQFKKIHEDPDIDNEDKFQYLVQSTVDGTRARDLVNSFPPTSENYMQAIECLKSRFGREDLLIEIYVRELLSLVLNNVSGKGKQIPLFEMYDKIETHLRALETLGVTRDKYASMLYPLVESCLPIDILRIWERNYNSISLTPTDDNSDKLLLLMKFLQNEIESEEKVNIAKVGFGLDKQNEKKNTLQSPYRLKSFPTAAELVSTSQTKKDQTHNVCISCNKAHESGECKYAFNLSLDERKKVLFQKGACYICLKPKHLARFCKVRINCSKCSKHHNTIMCDMRNLVYSNQADSSKVKHNQNSETLLVNKSCSQQVLLQTLIVRIYGKDQERLIRVIIDSGSQKSYISKYAAQSMGYEYIDEEVITHGLFGGSEVSEKHKRFKVQLSNFHRDYHCNFEVMDKLRICSDISKAEKGPWLKDLKTHHIFLTDLMTTSDLLYEHSSSEIHLLIGADVAGKLMTGKIIQLPCGLTAIETRLGWTVMGKIPKKCNEEDSTLLVLSLHVNEAKISDLWNLDTLGILDPDVNRDKREMEELTMKHFLDTVTRDSEGRYTVCLPWLEDYHPLPSNKTVAEKRLKNTVNSLKTIDKLGAYETVFKEWLSEGIIEIATIDRLYDHADHYLPHRAIIKENSTTKIRPVFDASARENKLSPSLNDCLHKGPNLVEVIPAVLNRFRLGNIGVIADIRKAFLQIGLSQRDRNFLRFFWWENGNPDQLQVYRHCRVVFGVSSSPFLLGATLSYHLERAPEEFVETAKKLSESMYVDNCISSVNTEEELRKFILDSRLLLSSAKFDLRGWIYNFQFTKPETDNNIELLEILQEKDPIVPILGLKWNIEDDTLSCDVRNYKEVNKETLTKRLILSTVHRIFDPIGYTCPVTLGPKLLLQECWKLSLSWDAELPEDISKEFKIWKNQLNILERIKIPRQLTGISENTKDKTLHVFCDASKLAYATCIFLRSEINNEITCQLVQGRSRVSPMKHVSIPRLELLACSIGARLAHSVKSDLHMENIKTYYWSDSMDAIYWIRKEELWATFVANRVKEIRNLTEKEMWFHISGKLNPADLPSRGCSAKTLAEEKWWEGPKWLKQPQVDWPTSKEMPNLEVVNTEKRKSIISALSHGCKEENYYYRISSYTKILRVTAWMYRFIDNIRKIKDSRIFGELSVSEMEKAELILLKQVQKDSFNERDEKLNSLQPITDCDGLLRTKTRIIMREDDTNFRYPIILPSKHHVVDKLIIWKHEETGHAGVQALMSILREDFWIIRSRKTIRCVIKRCIKCQRFTACSSKMPTAPLPKDRVRQAAVFEIIGVDLTGPLILKGRNKTWIAIFTCAIYRAVHLEMLTAISTENFLQALRRFIARRGRPSIIYSDNGTNFVGANNMLKKIDWKMVIAHSTVQKITWKFIPPAAPWWGGWWERIIGMLKRILRKILGRASLNFEEMNTILCDCESFLNARPLTYVSDDTKDLVPLTPSMFFQEIRESGTPDLDHLDMKAMNRRYAYRQRIRNDLRNRFRSEYLGQLRQNFKFSKNTQYLKEGDIVLIGSDNSKRFEWPLAKVITLYPGRDGYVRVVKVKTKHGEQLRPIQRLFKLEVDCYESDLLRNVISKSSTFDEIDYTSKVKTTRCGRVIKVPKRFQD